MKPKSRKRPQGELRQSQLITTFGPGAMTDLPEHSVLIAGLESWGNAWDRTVIHEPRLSAKVAELLHPNAEPGSVQLETPPTAGGDLDGAETGIQAFLFPEWFVTQDAPAGESRGAGASRFLVHRNGLLKNKFSDPDTRKPLSVVPIRFVRACRKGHIGDIDWYQFMHEGGTACRNQGRQLYLDQRGTSGDLSEITVRCACGTRRNLAQIGLERAAVFGFCDGEQPWLGPNLRGPCGEMNRLLVRTASNAYFPQRISVISLPERDSAVREAVGAVWDFLSVAESEAEVGRERRKPKVQERIRAFTDSEVWAEIEARRNQAPASGKKVKSAELETLLAVTDEAGQNRTDGVFYARQLEKTAWDQPWMSGIEKVVLVHRLREVTALVGFTRFEPEAPDTEGEYDVDVTRAALSRNAEWVPAIENRGEGIFLQFRAAAIEAWAERPAVTARLLQLRQGFQAWKDAREGSRREFPPPAFFLLHTLAHLLITTISLECGYPASSVRERVYAMPGLGYGILLYTGSSDVEGTLGGLVDVGRRIADLLRSALEMGAFCSNDPVCAQHEPSDPNEQRFLLGAACHGCILIAETSCEQQNDWLDRALVVSTIGAGEAAFFQ